LKEVVVRGKVGTLYVVVWGSAEVGVAVMVRYYRTKEAMPKHNVRYDAGIQY
jgi:NADH:ubiquinone oxidoreductase subunit K